MAADPTPPAAPDDGLVGITIDGRSIRVPKGTLVTDVATELGIHIPIYCSHPKMDPVAVCRMCLVHVEKMPKLQPACATYAAEGMVVDTQRADVTKTREGMLEFLLAQPPARLPGVRPRRRVRPPGLRLPLRSTELAVPDHREGALQQGGGRSARRSSSTRSAASSAGAARATTTRSPARRSWCSRSAACTRSSTPSTAAS